jgi:hypothetical protein
MVSVKEKIREKLSSRQLFDGLMASKFIGFRLWMACEALRYFKNVKDKAIDEIKDSQNPRIANLRTIFNQSRETVRYTLISGTAREPYAVQLEIRPGGKFLDTNRLVDTLAAHGLKEGQVEQILAASYVDKEPSYIFTGIQV